MHPTIEGISKSIPSLPTSFYMVVCFTLDEALLNSTLLLYMHLEPQRIYNVLIFILTPLTVSAKIYKKKKKKTRLKFQKQSEILPFLNSRSSLWNRARTGIKTYIGLQLSDGFRQTTECPANIRSMSFALWNCIVEMCKVCVTSSLDKVWKLLQF